MSRGVVAALVRKDLCDVRWVFAFIVAFDVIALWVAHVELRSAVETLFWGAVPAAAGLAALSMVPVLAELHAADERTGTIASVRALPVRPAHFAAAKLVSTSVVIAGAVGVVVAFQEALFAVGAAADVDRFFDDPGTTVIVVALVAPILALASILAAITRDAMRATLSLVALLLACGATLFETTGEARWHAESVVTGLIAAGASPWCGAGIVGSLLVSLTTIRGRVARSGLRRVVAAGFGFALPVFVGVAGFVARESTRPQLAFDDPSLRVVEADVDPEGRWVALNLSVGGDRVIPSSVWIVNVESWSVERVSSPSWLPWAKRHSVDGWFEDGERLLIGLTDSAGRSAGALSLDPLTGAFEPASTELWMQVGMSRGVPMRRGGDDGSSRFVELTDGREVRIECRRVWIPERARHFVLYVGDDDVLRRLDRRTGESVVMNAAIEEGVHESIGPRGRRLILVSATESPMRLIDVETGQSRQLRGGTASWSWDDGSVVLAGRAPSGSASWSLHSMEGDEAFEPEPTVCWLRALPGDRWLAGGDRNGLYVLDASGRLLRTLREGF